MPTVTNETLTQRLDETERRNKEPENIDPKLDELADNQTYLGSTISKLRPLANDLTSCAKNIDNMPLDEDDRDAEMEDRQWQLRYSLRLTRGSSPGR